MSALNLKGRWAVVTGASSGLGVEFARDLARRGANLVLVARRAEPMDALAAELRGAQGVEIVVEPLDLGAPNASEEIMGRLAARAIAPDILVNNAGFGIHGEFLDQDADRLKAMLDLNVTALTLLTNAFARAMAARGEGYILLVASVGAYQPMPLYAAYGASKAYVLSFGEALNAELAPAVKVSVLSPGLMETGFTDIAGHTITPMLSMILRDPENAARAGIDIMLKGRASRIDGAINTIAILAGRLLPRWLVARLVLWAMRER